MRIGLRCVTKFENKYYRAEVTKNLPSVTEVSVMANVLLPQAVSVRVIMF